MPIIDPSLVHSLLKKYQKNKSNSIKFFSSFLDIAANNILQSSDTFKNYMQFVKDFNLDGYGLHEKLEMEYINLFDNNKYPNLPNLYKYFSKLLKENLKNDVEDGDFFKIQSNNSIFLFYQPQVDFSEHHSWFFTDSPIAILCVRLKNLDYIKYCPFIFFEIDLISSSGYTIVACITDIEDYNPFIDQLCKRNQVSEIHIIKNTDSKPENFSIIIERINSAENTSYIYLYSKYIQKNENRILYKLKKFKKQPRHKLIYFCDNVRNCIKEAKIEPIKPFNYCKNGFETSKLRIILNDIPLYDTNDDIKNTIPSYFTDFKKGQSIGYIAKDDFLNWNMCRVKITIYEDSKEITKYIDFDDIHFINPEFYVKSTLFLGKLLLTDINAINSVIKKTEEKCKMSENENFKKEFFFTLIKSKKSKKLLTYVLYAFKKHIPKFKFLSNQVLVAYKAIEFGIKNFISSENHGFVYQVATGEGKSSIVILIASVLALFHKTVHVISSSIILANRDYNDSFDFFKKLGLKSSVLLHRNEIPPFNDDIKKENYPKEFFRHKHFQNSIGLNLKVCTEADIIFSNLINFESYYIYLNDNYPADSKRYYKNCSVVIDEADLVLIDEITNGTIMSRSINSNAEEVLSFVYEKRSNDKKITANDLYSEIIKKWPECTDIKPKNIEKMFTEIDLVNEDEEFTNNKKYTIETIHSKNMNKNSKIIQKEIVPFNYDRTGIIERNKEFNGFIQQFIACKERHNMKPNEHIIMKELSINYVYVPHLMYISQYNSICGLTGTIGNKYDKYIIKEIFKLNIKKIPRHNPNRLYVFPPIICSTVEERNEHIVNEIIEYHKKKCPVLAVFSNPNDIDIIKEKIELHEDFKAYKVDIAIYDGKNDKIKPDATSGEEGAISLGTNVCGRGTNIQIGQMPLHVIVAYHSENDRTIDQAYGRTARHGSFGTARKICLISEYLVKHKKEYNTRPFFELEEKQKINKLQKQFIDTFKRKRNWIFDKTIAKPQKISYEDIKILRNMQINVNRIKACNFKYPICMKVPTFLDIQAQKILSLYNCPNSKYTWQLFQQYIREMILTSWSIVLNRSGYENYKKSKKDIKSYIQYLDLKMKKAIDQLLFYLPNKHDKLNIVSTYMHIVQIVEKKYSSTILKSFYNLKPEENAEEDETYHKPKMSMIKIGFRPFSLIQKSGSKIYSLLFNEPQINYIIDPELKYKRRESKSIFSIFSITEKIDNIFEWIFNFFSNFIGNKIGFKFFLRRTLGGCEFGICYDFDLENEIDDVKNLTNCLIDTDPLFVFSISVKSVISLMAGILIFLLLYIANIARQIATFIQQIPKLSIKLVKKAVISLAKLLAEEAFQKLEEEVMNRLCGYLKSILDKQISQFMNSRKDHYYLFKMLSELIVDNLPNAGDKIYEGFKIKINTKVGKIMKDGFKHLFKVGFMLILCIASFLINFQINKSINFNRTKVAQEFTEDQNKEKITQYVNDNEKIFNNQIPKL